MTTTEAPANWDAQAYSKRYGLTLDTNALKHWLEVGRERGLFPGGYEGEITPWTERYIRQVTRTPEGRVVVQLQDGVALDITDTLRDLLEYAIDKEPLPPSVLTLEWVDSLTKTAKLWTADLRHLLSLLPQESNGASRSSRRPEDRSTVSVAVKKVNVSLDRLTKENVAITGNLQTRWGLGIDVRPMRSREGERPIPNRPFATLAIPSIPIPPQL